MSVSSNADKVNEDFSRVLESVKGNITKALETSAILVEADAKESAPVDLGQLKGSIYHKQGIDSDGAKYAEVGTNVEYAPYVEFGTGIFASNGLGRKTGWAYENRKGETIFTRGNKPQPFLTPALESNRSRIVQILASGVKEGTS